MLFAGETPVAAWEFINDLMNKTREDLVRDLQGEARSRAGGGVTAGGKPARSRIEPITEPILETPPGEEQTGPDGAPIEAVTEEEPAAQPSRTEPTSEP
jgi:hypothetical protein